MVSVSIIFVNYNEKKEYLRNCISSLYNQTYKGFEIIFVDNSPKDDSVEFVKKNFPKVKVIKSKKNIGFAGGNNLGVKNSKGKYIFILNLDTELEKNCLKELVEYLKNKKDVIACPKILYANQRNRINTTGTAFHYLGFGWCDNLGKLDDNKTEEREVTFPSGAAFLVDKKIFNLIKGFDKDYFLYNEDTDFGWRLRLMGYKIMLIPNAKVYHNYLFTKHSSKIYFSDRNRIITILKNYQFKTLLLILPPFLITEIGVLFYFLVHHSFFNKLKGYCWILKNFGSILEKRKMIQRTRNVEDKDIVKHFSSTIDIKEINSPLINRILNPILDAYWKMIKSFV